MHTRTAHQHKISFSSNCSTWLGDKASTDLPHMLVEAAGRAVQGVQLGQRGEPVGRSQFFAFSAGP